LLSFNLGIELMQLFVVALVLPPRVVLARFDRYRRLRLAAASLTPLAALGWRADRLGYPNDVAAVADRLGAVAVPSLVVLWLACAHAYLVGTGSARVWLPRPLSGAGDGSGSPDAFAEAARTLDLRAAPTGGSGR
jgi:hypothetical protein